MIPGKGKVFSYLHVSVGIALLFISMVCDAQDNWKENKLEKNLYSGIPMACADINGDAIDDLVVLDQAKHLWIGINNGFARFFWKELPYHQTFLAWSINVADIDNNGYNDILISGATIKLIILYQDRSGFTQTIVDDANFFTQAACAFDYNRDGWLDFTITDDNEATRHYLNNGSGLLMRDTASLDMNLIDRSKNGGNYGCIWTDFDWDGDPDLYISKCKPGVDNPNDLQRINLLYVNENNVWKEEAGQYQLKIGDQSWISLFEDFDNDALPDAYVLNHYTASLLLKQNVNHHFEDRTQVCGIDSKGFAFQALAFDFDNDADLDLLLCGTSTEIWLNDGAMKFTLYESSLSELPFSSCAVGDFNQDGFPDIYASYADLLNRPANRSDRLWMNPGNQNHYISFNFRGKHSNRNGIGVKVKLYTANKIQVRELHAGESYGIQNSLNLTFGLNQATWVDSVIFFWPSGITDTFYQLDANRKYLVIEGSCLYDFKDSDPSIGLIFCGQVDTVLNADQNYHSVVWNNGTTGHSLRVREEGVYYYNALDENQCPMISNVISILLNPVSKPRLNTPYSRILCGDESLEIRIDGFNNVLWSTGEISAALTISNSGNYFGMVNGYCMPETSDTLHVLAFSNPDPPGVQTDTIAISERAMLLGDRENINWFLQKEDLLPVYTGKNFNTDTLSTARSFWAETFELHKYPYIRGGPVEPVFESSPYHADFINNQMLFNVYQPIVLDSVTIYTDDPGNRQIQLFDAKGLLYNTTDLYLNRGKNQVFLGYSILPSNRPYILTTNESKNIETFGVKSPKLYRTDKDFYYPFLIEDKLRILTSDKGDSYFYYFYDWVIHHQDKACTSDRIEVPVIVNPVTNDDRRLTDVELKTPDGKIFWIESDLAKSYRVEIVRMEGLIIGKFEALTAHEKFLIPDLASGMYLILINENTGKRLKSIKWVVSR